MKKLLIILLIIAQSVKSADFHSAIQFYENENYKEAFVAFQRLAEIGEVRSQLNLGVMYYHGQGVKKDLNKAYAWTKLVSLSKTVSDSEKEVFNNIKKEVKDYQTAEVVFDDIYKKYSGEALLDNLYPVLIKKKKQNFHPELIKSRVPEYPTTALRKGVQGWVRVQFDLDKLGNPRNIRVVESVPKKTFNQSVLRTITKWRFKPEKDDKDNLVESYGYSYTFEFRVKNKDTSKDSLVDKKYYKKIKEAAYHGKPMGQLKYGYMLERFSGLGEKENATSWYFKSAMSGVPTAQFLLGKCLIRGYGCKLSKVKGMEWLNRAASNGSYDANEFLAGLALSNKDKDSQLRAISYFSKVKKLSPSGKIKYAWLLTTSPFKEIVDPDKAIKLVKSIKRREYRDKVTKKELVAAAYAAKGNYKKAINYQDDALDDAKDQGFDTNEIESRLTLYQQKKKWF